LVFLLFWKKRRKKEKTNTRFLSFKFSLSSFSCFVFFLSLKERKRKTRKSRRESPQKRDFCNICVFCFENKKRHSTRYALTIFTLSERHVRSKIQWFTELCNSHYVSHFAAFFIDTRAERSTVESCEFFFFYRVGKYIYNIY